MKFDSKRYDTLKTDAMKSRVNADLFDWRARRLIAAAILAGAPLGKYNDGEDGSIYFLGAFEVADDILDELGNYDLEFTPATAESDGRRDLIVTDAIRKDLQDFLADNQRVEAEEEVQAKAAPKYEMPPFNPYPQIKTAAGLIYLASVEQREEICRAFVCKYGIPPEECEQVYTPDPLTGFYCWSVRRKSTGPADTKREG